MDRMSLLVVTVVAGLGLITAQSSQPLDILQYTQTNCPNNSVLVKLARCDPSITVEQLANLTEEFNNVFKYNQTDSDIEEAIKDLLKKAGVLDQTISSAPKRCGDMAREEKMLRCSSLVMKACTDMDKADSLPDADNLVAGLHYLCQNIKDLDLECIEENVVGIGRCASQQTLNYIDSLPTNTSAKDYAHEIQCSTYKFQSQCARHILILCEDSGPIYANYVNYMAPTYCGLLQPQATTSSPKHTFPAVIVG